MAKLIAGLALFFAIHSISIVALPLRDRLAARSELGWKAFYSLVSLVGIALASMGYAELRATPHPLYVPPVWLRHVSLILLLPVFVLVLAPYFPGRIRSAVRHPQLLAVMLWAFAHLLANGTLADALLFGSFLVWAVADRLSMNWRPARRVPSVPRSRVNDAVLAVLGAALYAAMLLGLHEALLGAKPL